MKILIHSKNSDSGGLALRFLKEGHKVFMFTELPFYRNALRNMGIIQVNSMAEGVKDKPDFVMFDREGNGDLADRLKKAGLAVCCASAMADKMELDRKFGLDLMEKNGIKIPKTENFNRMEDAVAYIKKNPNCYAIKVDGNVGASSSYVSCDDKDMLDYLAYQEEVGKIKKGSKFVLQEVVKGVEISTEVWFSHGRPVQPFNGTFETKKFMPGDLGPNTGCETSAVFSYRTSTPKMVQKTIAKIFPFMEKEKWTGPLDINCIVSEKDHEPYGLEWTVRLGYSAIYGLAALIEDGIGEFFHGIATGKIDRIKVKHSWATSLRLSIPPYPYENPEDDKMEEALYENVKGLRVKAPDDKNWWPLDVEKDGKDRIITSGGSGTVGECTGTGETIYQAWKKSQKIFDGVKVPNKMGRYVDGAERAFKDTTKLRSWGYQDVTKP